MESHARDGTRDTTAVAEELRSRRNDPAIAIDQPERLLPLARGNKATPLRHGQVHEVTGDLGLLEHGNRT
jgi:hypothetical protein